MTVNYIRTRVPPYHLLVVRREPVAIACDRFPSNFLEQAFYSFSLVLSNLFYLLGLDPIK